MAGKKRRKKRGGKRRSVLNSEEQRELDIICDRLSVQNPEGESLERCLETLKTTLDGRDALVVALLDRLSRKPASVAVRVYQEFKDLVTAGSLQRTLRQVEYRLRQRGLVSEPEGRDRRKEANVVLVPKEQVPSEAVLLMADGVWAVAALVPSRYDEGLVMACMDVDFSWRILAARADRTTRKQFREFVTRFVDRAPLRIPVRHAAGLVMEALERSPEQKRTWESDRTVIELRPWLEPNRVPYPHEVFAKGPVEFDGTPETAAREVIESLLPAIKYLVPAKSELRPYYERLRSIQDSLLIISEAVREEQIESLLVEAAAASYDERGVYYHRLLLEELALQQKMGGDDRKAGAFWTMARRLGNVRSGAEQSYFSDLILAGFFHYWPENIEGEKPPVDPGMRTTESGIILP